jgi:hypothetical protein
MAVRDHISVVNKLRGIVTTVDPGNMVLEVTCQDRQPRRIFLADVPSGFTWPKEGEQWSIYEENGYWRLGNRFPQGIDDFHISQMEPGEGMTPDVLWTPIGNKIEFNGDFNVQTTQTRLSALEAPPTNLFRIVGDPGVSTTVTNGSYVTMNGKDDGSMPYQYTITPTIDCWFPVYGITLVRTLDAAWGRTNYGIWLNQNDALGVGIFLSAIEHHNAAADWVGGTVASMWALAANTTYLVSMGLQVAPGNWQYYRGGGHTALWSTGIFPR